MDILAICQPENANIEVYEGEDAVLKVTCDQDVSVTLIAFCNGITASKYTVTHIKMG